MTQLGGVGLIRESDEDVAKIVATEDEVRVYRSNGNEWLIQCIPREYCEVTFRMEGQG